MTPIFSTAAAEFLEQYQRDVQVRWAPEDLAAQQAFVNGHLAGCAWLDWSTAPAALDLAQAAHAHTAVDTAEKFDALVLAGPMVELLEPTTLFSRAVGPLCRGGKLIGIMPCLRDNSPESQQFIQHAGALLWPYYTAEELVELLRETGLGVVPQAGGFVTVPQFNQAVLKDQLAFKGFGRVFERLMAEGYDPMEVGWGELRLVATLE